MVQVAVSAACWLGVKVTLAVQLEDAARLEPQVVVEIEKSPALVPESTGALRATEFAVVLVTVMDAGLLVEPRVTLPKDKLPGAAVTLPVGPPVPRPERATCWGLDGSLSVKVRFAVRIPEIVGTKITVVVQLEEAAKVEPQLFLLILKSPGLAPVSAMLLMVIALLPVLVRVAVFCPPA